MKILRASPRERNRKRQTLNDETVDRKSRMRARLPVAGTNHVDFTRVQEGVCSWIRKNSAALRPHRLSSCEFSYEFRQRILAARNPAPALISRWRNGRQQGHSLAFKSGGGLKAASPKQLKFSSDTDSHQLTLMQSRKTVCRRNLIVENALARQVPPYVDQSV